MIKFNSKVVVTSEVVVKPGSQLDLQCEGDGPVNWQTRLPKHKRFVSKSHGTIRSIKVERPTAEFTGTYKCYYTGGSMYRNLTSSVHVYVKGEVWRGGCPWCNQCSLVPRHDRDFVASVRPSLPDPHHVFWTSSTSLRMVRKEGEDSLLPCLLTDPEATDLGLRMDNGTSVPPGMNYIVYRHRGILISSLQPSFTADYVCTARINGMERTSKAFSINVIQSNSTFTPCRCFRGTVKGMWFDANFSQCSLTSELRFPPYVFLETDEYVRIVGEELKIHCSTHNPNFNYNVTWKYTTKSVSV